MAMIYIIPPIVTGALDPATTAWVNAVVAAGGTVSSGRKTIVDALIVGLKTDGIFTKLDRLWLFAAENTQSALIDVKGLGVATVNSAPTFATDRGYTGNGTTSWIASDIFQNTGGLNFIQNSACYFGWSNTSGAEDKGFIGLDSAQEMCRLFPLFSDTNLYWDINNSVNGAGIPSSSGATGLYLMNRTASNASTVDLNGSQLATSATVSTVVVTTQFAALKGGAGGDTFSTRQCSAWGIGGQLSGTDRTNIYTRLRAYMTAVGVP